MQAKAFHGPIAQDPGQCIFSTPGALKLPLLVCFTLTLLANWCFNTCVLRWAALAPLAVAHSLRNCPSVADPHHSLHSCNSVALPPTVVASVQMQNKYLEQYDELYGEDMHLLKMPLLEEEVRGVERLQIFSQWLLTPYEGPGGPAMDPFTRIAELEQQVADLKLQLSQRK
jgi:Anion-transporting ATPase